MVICHMQKINHHFNIVLSDKCSVKNKNVIVKTNPSIATNFFLRLKLAI